MHVVSRITATAHAEESLIVYGISSYRGKGSQAQQPGLHLLSVSQSQAPLEMRGALLSKRSVCLSKPNLGPECTSSTCM